MARCLRLDADQRLRPLWHLNQAPGAAATAAATPERHTLFSGIGTQLNSGQNRA